MVTVRIDLHQRARQEIRLLLIIAFQGDAIAGLDQGLQRVDDGPALQELARGVRAQGRDTPCLGLAQARPRADGDLRLAHGTSWRAPARRRAAWWVCACRPRQYAVPDA